MTQRIGSNRIANTSITTNKIVDGAILGNDIGVGQITGNLIATNQITSNLIASNLTFTLPTADGSNGQALVTDGSGVLSFAESSSDL